MHITLLASGVTVRCESGDLRFACERYCYTQFIWLRVFKDASKGISSLFHSWQTKTVARQGGRRGEEELMMV